jgi:hypothetical protein
MPTSNTFDPAAETSAETVIEATIETVAAAPITPISPIAPITPTTPAAIAAFQSFYLAELDNRVKRSEVVGAITLKKGSAALFYEPAEGKFTLVEKMPDVEEANVFDCVPREQWGRMVMLFGHATNTGGYIPSGHAILDGNTVKIRLASGHYYRMDVDATLPHLLPFVGEPSKPRQEQARQQPLKREPRPAGRNNKPKGRQLGNQPSPGLDAEQHVSHHAAAYDGDERATNDECEDLTEEDLRRLRGEMPLTNKPKKKWKH